MHWLLIALIVSLCALLLATGGLARYIWLQRAKHRRPELPKSARSNDDLESEP
jgi:uncharacterized iron-regulated membrane protein